MKIKKRKIIKYIKTILKDKDYTSERDHIIILDENCSVNMYIKIKKIK